MKLWTQGALDESLAVPPKDGNHGLDITVGTHFVTVNLIRYGKRVYYYTFLIEGESKMEARAKARQITTALMTLGDQRCT